MKDKKKLELVDLLLDKSHTSVSALRLIAHLISIIEEGVYIYKIRTSEHYKKIGIKTNSFHRIRAVALELANKQFEYFDERNEVFLILQMIVNAKYKNGLLTIKINEDILDILLDAKRKYSLKYISTIMSFRSIYSAKVYTKLKKFAIDNKVKTEDVYIVDVNTLKRDLKIPASYKWPDIRRQILDRAEKELNNSDISFKYETIISKNKVVAVKFYVTVQKPKIEDESQFAEYVSKNYQSMFFGWEISKSNSDSWLTFKGDNLVNAEGKLYSSEEKKKLLHFWYMVYQHNLQYRECIELYADLKKELSSNKDFVNAIKETIRTITKKRGKNGRQRKMQKM